MVTQAERLAKLEVTSSYIKERLDEFIECADSKYAVKHVEKIVYATAGVVLTAVVLSGVSVIVGAIN